MVDSGDKSVIIIYFDYYVILGRFLKFDIFGYDDLIVIRMFQDLIGVDLCLILFDDKVIMLIFISIEVFGIFLEDIDCEVGIFGILEFGIRFVR